MSDEINFQRKEGKKSWWKEDEGGGAADGAVGAISFFFFLFCEAGFEMYPMLKTQGLHCSLVKYRYCCQSQGKRSYLVLAGPECRG